MEHGLGTCDLKHPPEFTEEQTVTRSVWSSRPCGSVKKSWVVQPQDVIVSHQTEFAKSPPKCPFCRKGQKRDLLHAKKKGFTKCKAWMYQMALAQSRFCRNNSVTGALTQTLGCAIGLTMSCSHLVTFSTAHPFSKQLAAPFSLGVFCGKCWFCRVLHSPKPNFVDRPSGRCQPGVGGRKPTATFGSGEFLGNCPQIP